MIVTRYVAVMLAFVLVGCSGAGSRDAAGPAVTGKPGQTTEQVAQGLRVALTPLKDRFLTDESPVVTLSVENVSDETVRIRPPADHGRLVNITCRARRLGGGPWRANGLGPTPVGWEPPQPTVLAPGSSLEAVLVVLGPEPDTVGKGEPWEVEVTLRSPSHPVDNPADVWTGELTVKTPIEFHDLTELPAKTLIGCLRTDYPVHPDVCSELARRWKLPAPIAPQPIQDSRAVRSLNGRYVLFFVERAFDGHGFPARQGLHAVLINSSGTVMWSKALRFADWPAVANDATVAVGEWTKDPSVVRVRMIAADGTLLDAHGATPTEYFLDHVRRNPGTVRSAFGTIVSQGFSRDASRFCFQTRAEYQAKPRLFCVDRTGRQLWSTVLGRQYGGSPGNLLRFSPDGRYALLADTNAAPSDGFGVFSAADGHQVLDEKVLRNPSEFIFEGNTLTVVDQTGRRDFHLGQARSP